MRTISLFIFAVVLCLADVAIAQQPLTVIQAASPFGPICEGPRGPGPCPAVARFLEIERRALLNPLQPVSADAWGRPICDGPLGEGLCYDVQMYLAAQQIAQEEISLQQINNVAGVGPICVGPLGPGPCDGIRLYLLQSQVGLVQQRPFDPRKVEILNNTDRTVGPICEGPSGPMPCTLVAQIGIDKFAGQVPSPASFGITANEDNAQKLAKDCANEAGLDVSAFAGCVGQDIILPEKVMDVLDCAVSSRVTSDFANCAAPSLGIDLPPLQKKIAGCAIQSGGDAVDFANCAGSDALNGMIDEDQRAILQCASVSNADPVAFVGCASDRFLTQDKMEVLQCAISSADIASFTSCASPHIGIKLSDDQRLLARCASSSNGDMGAFGTCAGSAFLGKTLGPTESAVLSCATNSSGNVESFASCSAPLILGTSLSREQKVALECAAQAQGNPDQFAACAGANMFNLQLNPEQQIAVQCVVSTGGQPYAAAGCIGSRLTARELTKCLTDGIGGRGCFGDNNDLVGKNGWLRRNLGDIAGGPNSIFHNPDQIWGGDNSFVRNPEQIFGGNNSFVRNPSQLWGGNNSIFNNPGQLLSTPKPLQLGTIGGKRICLPWC